MAEHRFFQVDRYKLLIEGQEVKPDERGLSRFGAVYWDAIASKPFESLNESEQSEFLLEAIRKEPLFSAYASRMRSLGGSCYDLGERLGAGLAGGLSGAMGAFFGAPAGMGKFLGPIASSVMAGSFATPLSTGLPLLGSMAWAELKRW